MGSGSGDLHKQEVLPVSPLLSTHVFSRATGWQSVRNRQGKELSVALCFLWKGMEHHPSRPAAQPPGGRTALRPDLEGLWPVDIPKVLRIP